MSVRFDERFLDELKSRLRISDIVGRTVPLKRAGREFVGLSPFNKEKTPSFYVNDDKGQFFDFSSGKNGDLISFLQEAEKLSFVEAVEKLAAEAGMALPVVDAHAAVLERQRQGLTEWIALAAQWYEAQLRRPIGEEARRYLARRELPENEWSKFGIGFAPAGRTGLKDYLIAKGARTVELIDAGLLVAPEDGSPPYDRFRNRIMFPITDLRDRVISFGGRALDSNARAKYLNGPDTELFDKGHTLYGLSSARRALRAAEDPDKSLFVVEGYFDVIACQRAGLPAVASMGTALTESQLALLWRQHPAPTLCFDADAAGRRAEGRAIERALPLLTPVQSLTFTSIGGGKDPDDVLRDHGIDALRRQLGKTRSFVDALFDLEFERTPLETPESRAALKGRLRRAAGTIRDRDVSEQYRTELFDRFYERTKGKRFSRGNDGGDFVSSLRSLLPATISSTLSNRLRTFNAAVAYAAIQHPLWIREHIDGFARWGFGDDRMAPIVQPILDAIQEDHVTHELVLRHIKSDSATRVLETVKRHAMEVNNFPFVSANDDDAEKRALWERSLAALWELCAIDEELKERRQALADRKPLLYPESHAKRGPWLRERVETLGREITDGVSWGAPPGVAINRIV